MSRYLPDAKLYTVKIPIDYNSGNPFDIKNGSNIHFIFEENRYLFYKYTCHYKIDVLKLDLPTEVNFYIVTEDDNEQNKFFVYIENILADDRQYAINFIQGVENILYSLCLALSLQVAEVNCNPHNYQPRFTIDFNKIKYESHEYGPYLEWKRNIVKSGNEILQHDKMCMRESVHSIILQPLDTNSFGEYFKFVENKNDLYIVLKQYYLGLGTEHVESKYFHLFAIIEYIEREYVDLAGANRICSSVSSKDVDDFVNRISIDKIYAANVSARIQQVLKSITDLNRVQKLVRILNSMGIDKIGLLVSETKVDESLVKTLIERRNKLFHAGNNKESKEADSAILKKQVTQLLEIDFKVIRYLKREWEQSNNVKWQNLSYED